MWLAQIGLSRCWARVSIVPMMVDLEDLVDYCTLADLFM